MQRHKLHEPSWGRRRKQVNGSWTQNHGKSRKQMMGKQSKLPENCRSNTGCWYVLMIFECSWDNQYLNPTGRTGGIPRQLSLYWAEIQTVRNFTEKGVIIWAVKLAEHTSAWIFWISNKILQLFLNFFPSLYWFCCNHKRLLNIFIQSTHKIIGAF